MTDEIKPAEDIDVTHKVDILRIERMTGDSVWFAGYRDDGVELHYNTSCTEDGLTIHTWHHDSHEEYSEEVERDYEIDGVASRDIHSCPDCGGDLKTVETDFGIPIECVDCGEWYEIEQIRFLRRYQEVHDNDE